MASTAAVLGSTGLVGSYILSNLLALDTFKAVHTLSRRQPKSESPKLNAQIEPDTTKWASGLTAISPLPDVVLSALGTTRTQAGGIQNQWKIDHDLNIELAKAAKAAGIKTFVFVSSAGTRSMFSGRVPYSQMKIGVEDTVQSLDFDHAIILRPGFILGEREKEKMHVGGPLLSGIFRGLGSVRQGFQDTFAQDAEVIARAAVRAAVLASEGKAPSKFWVLEAADIVKYGRDEWKP
ncbi:NAD(P)-binding protein [Xylariomycetidae sp. FL2044]|nr:NAD(P)-binding protein [Xylariomycetidae sp. FL2044]